MTTTAPSPRQLQTATFWVSSRNGSAIGSRMRALGLVAASAAMASYCGALGPAKADPATASQPAQAEAKSPNSEVAPEADAEALPEYQQDPLTRARVLAVDGKYTECAEYSDKARRLPGAHWRAHQVYASCKVFAADGQKDKLTPRAYAQEMSDAIAALDFLLNTPGVTPQHDRRQGLKAMRNQIKARADKVIAASGEPIEPPPAPRQF